MTRPVMRFCLLACLFAVGGCSTAHAVAANCPFPNQIYGGVRTELDTVNYFNMEHYLDVPFSAAADTLVLPYTIPRTLYNYAHPESRPCYKDWWNDVWLDHRYLADCHGSKH